MDNLGNLVAEYERRIGTLQKEVSAVSTERKDLQEMYEEETRAKLAVQAKLRATEDEREQLRDMLEEEEEAKKALEKQNMTLQQQVSYFDNFFCVCNIFLSPPIFLLRYQI